MCFGRRRFINVVGPGSKVHLESESTVVQISTSLWFIELYGGTGQGLGMVRWPAGTVRYLCIMVAQCYTLKLRAFNIYKPRQFGESERFRKKSSKTFLLLLNPTSHVET